MSATGCNVPQNIGFLKKLGTFFGYLLVLDLLLLAVFVFRYATGDERLASVVAALGQVMLVSAVLLLIKAQRSRGRAFSNLVLFWILLASSFALLGYRMFAL